jgi:Zn-dependent protease with chaperone function
MNSTALRADRADLGRVSNLVKTTVLLAALSALVLGFGSVLGGARGVMISGVIVLVMNFVSFWFSDRIALAMNRAQPLDPRMVPHVTDLVSRLAARAGLPMPKLYFIDSPTPNAFATGRSPDKAAIAVTRGLLETMGQRELTGVLAHELAHVKHRDTLIMTVAATLAGVISHAAQALFWFGGSMLNRGDDEEGPSSSLDGDALGEVARLIDVGAPQVGYVVREQLQRHGRDDRGDERARLRDLDDVVASDFTCASPSSTTAMTCPPRARTSSMFPRSSRSAPRLRRGDHHHRQLLVDERDGAVLHLAARVALGVNVGDLLELQRALERDRVHGPAPEEEEVLRVQVASGDGLHLRLGLAARSRRAWALRSAPSGAAAPGRAEGATQPAELDGQQVEAGELGGEGLGRGDADLGAGVGQHREVGLARHGRAD